MFGSNVRLSAREAIAIYERGSDRLMMICPSHDAAESILGRTPDPGQPAFGNWTRYCWEYAHLPLDSDPTACPCCKAGAKPT